MKNKPFQLIFKDQNLENEFLQEYVKISIWKTRLLSITAGVLFFLYAYIFSDILHPEHTDIIWTLASIEILITISYVYFSFKKYFSLNFRVFTIVYALALGMGCFSPMLFVPNDAGYYYIFLTISVSATIILAGMRIFDSILVIFTLMFIALSIALLRGVDAHIIITANFIILAITIFTSIGGYILEQNQRKNFLTNIELERLSLIDPLTSLKNRRFFNETLNQKCEELNRINKPFILIILDVDNFKAYNDLYGHPEGDIALKKLSKALESTIQRATDNIFRIGGEEFAIIMSYEKPEILEKLLDNMIKNTIKLDIEHHKNESHGKFTISIGATYANVASTECSQAFYKRADKALYRAKDNGKNCFVIDS